MSIDLSQFVVTKAAATSRIRLADLSVEEAREHVKVVDGNTKKPVEGYQGLTLKLGRVKVDLGEQFEKAVKLQVPEDQVEAVSAQLLEMVAAGSFDGGIEAAIAKLNEIAEPKTAAPGEAPSDEDFEPLPEE